MIKNLLFDLGGVIMDIDRKQCVKAFKALGLDNVESFLDDYTQSGPFAAIEEGRISPAEFRSELRAMMPGEVSDDKIDAAFEQFLTGIPASRLHELRELRRMGLGIYLLSNTNAIMWNGKIVMEFRHEGRQREDYFDGMLTSFECGVMKPDLRIFEIAAKRFGIVPDETLFIDDSQRNLDAAAELGYHTMLVKPGQDFSKLITKYLQ